MKYMLLIYNQPGMVDHLSEAERTELFGEVDAILAELTERGEMVAGEGLADPAGARTVRLQGGRPTAVDGPFMESKEQFGGFVIVDCETVERAIEIAERWPDVRFGGAIEVRAVMSEAGTEM